MDRRSLVVTSAGLARYLAGRGWDSRAIEAAVPVRPPAFSFLATPYYLDLIDWSDPDDPLRRMIWPDPREYDVRSYERADPIGDRAHEPVPGVVHRYPDRCLVMPTSACALHCRFCFRRNLLGGQRWDAGEALRYVSSHAEIQEIILSGGDPLMLPETELEHVMRDLGGIGHIRRLRVHTRIPVADPERISESLLRALRAGRRPLRMVLHINHPREVTPDLRRAVHRLQSAGLEVLSQSVLLRGVNDQSSVLEALFAGIMAAGIRPYYLHHPDAAAGTHHFRVSMEEGRRLYETLRRRMPSSLVPRYVLDTPESPGKTPITDFQRVGMRDYEARLPGNPPILYRDGADFMDHPGYGSSDPERWAEGRDDSASSRVAAGAGDLADVSTRTR